MLHSTGFCIWNDILSNHTMSFIYLMSKSQSCTGLLYSHRICIWVPSVVNFSTYVGEVSMIFSAEMWWHSGLCIFQLAKTQGNVFATDAIIATLMCCTRSVYSWDIIVQRVGNKLFLDKRDDSEFGEYLLISIWSSRISSFPEILLFCNNGSVFYIFSSHLDSEI